MRKTRPGGRHFKVSGQRRPTLMMPRHHGAPCSLLETFRHRHNESGSAQVGISWVALASFASLPFAFSNLLIGLTDACFGSKSDLTTTGSNVLVRLDAPPMRTLLWRAILQRIGGVGIIVMTVAVLPPNLPQTSWRRATTSVRSRPQYPVMRHQSRRTTTTWVCHGPHRDVCRRRHLRLPNDMRSRGAIPHRSRQEKLPTAPGLSLVMTPNCTSGRGHGMHAADQMRSSSVSSD